MDTIKLRHSIEQARLLEDQNGQLAAQLSRIRPSLHRAIKMPRDNAIAVLLDFVVRYTEHVAEFVDVLSIIGINANCCKYTEAVVNFCTGAFDQTPDLLEGQNQLSTLMAQAYIAHRVIEEVNEHFSLQCHEPLIPMDMTRSNLIIHQLIGEPLANHLDLIAQEVAEQLERDYLRLDSGIFDNNARREIAWGIEITHWPCLTDTLAVGLLLGQGCATSPSIH
ncbi:MAG: hypothetical protein KBT88_04745 [Gammaproteobacteria bacterium]|nr:hypothetical protein [Gammaproteobacteria bacterium]MBQ0839074.1 hypothetical protein [Gammaproteobacteria bacterium]